MLGFCEKRSQKQKQQKVKVLRARLGFLDVFDENSQIPLIGKT